MRGGNAYFIKNAKGNIVLMAENIKEYDRPLSGFKRRYRKAEASSGSNVARCTHRRAGAPVQPQEAPERRTHRRRSIPRLSARIEKQLRLVD